MRCARCGWLLRLVGSTWVTLVNGMLICRVPGSDTEGRHHADLSPAAVEDLLS